MSNKFSYLLYLINQLEHKVQILQVKHGYELVIVGLAAMQRCSYFKSQGSGKSRRDPQLRWTSNSAE